MLKAGDGARGNARTVLQPLGSDAGQRRTANGIARAFPCLARHAQHRALAGPGIADDNTAKTAPIGHMLERRALLAGQDKAALSAARASAPSRPDLDLMPLALRQQFRCAMQAAARSRSSRAW
jgi:hypothetical protein